jgi:hypothetical protein
MSCIVTSPLAFANNSNWYFSSENINGTQTYNVYGIDESIENAISITCDKKMTTPIIAIQTNEYLTKKESSIVSLRFDSDKKIKYTANYDTNTAWSTPEKIGFSNFSLIIDKLRKSKKVEIGFVKKNGKSAFFTVDLQGSSNSINKLTGKCKNF